MGEIARSRVGVATYLIPGTSLNERARTAELQQTIDACMEARELQIVLDLSGVAVMNSEALEILLDAQARLSRLGGEIKVANTNAVVEDVFRVTGIAGQLSNVEGRAPGLDPSRRGQRIGEILVDKDLVSEEIIQKALDVQRRTGERLAQILLEKGWVSEKELMVALGEQLGLPFVWLRSGVYDPEVVRLVDVEVARRLKVMPLFRVGTVLYLATADPQSVPSLDAVADITGLSVRAVLASASEILKSLAEIHAEGTDLSEYMADLEGDLEVLGDRSLEDHAVIDQMAAGSPVVNLINGIIQRAVTDSASDIHIEPTRTRCKIRLRLDGILYPIMEPPIEVHPALVSRLKVMANLDIAERRLPQDGRIQVVTRGRVVDLRFSSLPGILGEKVVLRILDKVRGVLQIERLGMTSDNEDRFLRLLAQTNGLLLVTGPTGSGKTTTLYAAINKLKSSERNIVTIEDPVEYQLDGINQNQVRGGIGLDFARFLKHALRQDPDIIMVGEIRERETAEVAIQAALTGHLVLSTLHTNDSIGALTRLLDMRVPPYLLSSALLGVMAQRLVRTVCSECKTTYVASPETFESHDFEVEEPVQLSRGRGCSECYDSGYKGRMAVHEIVESSVDLQRLIVSNPTRQDLDGYMAQHGIRTLLRDGIARAVQGRTSLEEVLRVVNS